MLRVRVAEVLGDAGIRDSGLYARVVVAVVPSGWRDLTAATDTGETTRVYDFAFERPWFSPAEFLGATPVIAWRRTPKTNVREGVNRCLMRIGLPPRW